MPSDSKRRAQSIASNALYITRAKILEDFMNLFSGSSDDHKSGLAQNCPPMSRARHANFFSAMISSYCQTEVTSRGRGHTHTL